MLAVRDQPGSSRLKFRHLLAGIKAACFPADGRVLLTATAEGLCSHAWDPPWLHDAIEVPWPKVCAWWYRSLQ